MNTAKADPTPPILELTDVVKTFGQTTAVNGLSFQLHAGEILAVLGPNGAGKTTTVEMCEGFHAPTSGTIRVFGMDPVAESDAVRARIGVMLQGGGAYPGIRVGEMLHLVASYSADPLDPDWLLDVVGLSDHRRTPYRRLSGGQQQRLSLACALVGRPELVFLDEPTAGLDAQSRMMVWDLIRSLRRDGVSVILTTHLMDEAEELADRVIIIDRGSIVASGTSRDLATVATQSDSSTQTSGAHIIFETADLLDASIVARLGDRLSTSGSPVTVSEVPDRAATYRILGGAASPAFVSAVAAACAAEDVLLRRLDVNRHSLEDSFLAITGRELRRKGSN